MSKVTTKTTKTTLHTVHIDDARLIRALTKAEGISIPLNATVTVMVPGGGRLVQSEVGY